MYKRFFTIMLVLVLILPYFVYAEETNAVDENSETPSYQVGYLTGDVVRVRTSTDTSSISNVLAELNTGDMVKVLATEADSNGACANWYKILYNEQEAYICGAYVRIKNQNIQEAVLDLSLFPSSYHASLTALHEKYPSWVFLPLETNLDFKTAVKNESNIGDSLIYYTYNEGYRSFSSASYNYYEDKFYYDKTEGSNWYYASEQTVAYYMDPRNFLDERYIFMFEDLSYNPSFQNANTVQNVLGNTFMPTLYNKFPDILSLSPTYADAFIKASELYDISPLHLASRVRQEMGVNGSGSSSGASFTYNNKTYSGLYNFYNIGAYGYSPTYVAGLIWANGGVDGTLTTYYRPWTDPYRSILGGASYLSSGYISKGQNTLYLERFNVSPTDPNKLYTHQYMTNISAHVSEASTTYSSYNSLGLLDESLVFLIPIYKNMPEEKSALPNKGNPNNYLKNIQINSQNLSDFSNDKTSYDYVVSSDTKEIKLSATPINSKSSIEGLGTISLEEEKTTIELKVIAENKDERIYTIQIIKESSSSSTEKGEETKPPEEEETEPEKEIEPVYKTLTEILDNSSVKYNDKYISGLGIGYLSSTLENNIKKVEEKASVLIKDKDGNLINRAFRTGDIIKITSGKEEKEYQIVIYGDASGDGEITILDLLRVQRHLLGTIKLEGAYLKASDVNKDNEVTILDLLKIQKHLLGSSKIED